MSREFKGFAFISFQKDVADAATDRAVSMSGSEIGGQEIIVSYNNRDWLKTGEPT